MNNDFILIRTEDALKYLTDEEKKVLCKIESKIRLCRAEEGLPEIKYIINNEEK